MQEIKWRVRNFFTDEWLYYKATDLEGVDNAGLSWNLNTISEHTGLKDKNGVEIYEGDVVKVFEIGSDGSILWESINVVEKDAPNGGYNFRDTNGEYWDFFYQDFEVIGNIYENPELIKQ